MNLDHVDWSGVLAEIDARRERPLDPHTRRVLADAESLSALFTTELGDGAARIRSAIRADPLNPIHRFRMALLHMRFGQWDRVLELTQAMTSELPDTGLPLYLRALASLKQGEVRRAANIAEQAATRRGFAPAQFLQVEAIARHQLKGVAKLLASLPRDEEFAWMWGDLVMKLAVSRLPAARKLAKEYGRKNWIAGEGSPLEGLLARLFRWSEGDIELLEAELGEVAEGSRAEELLLLFIYDRVLKDFDPEAAIGYMRRLSARHPGRGAIRRVYTAMITRLAIEEAASERYSVALRYVEQCIRLEPHELVHYQNRAALFTLTRETSAYHEAWEEVERQQYRHVLLGNLDDANLRAIAKRHRLFAQQALLPPRDGVAGRAHAPAVFQVEAVPGADASLTRLVLDEQHVIQDPDLLRQWIHNRRAELVFAHWALGPDPVRPLLHPRDIDVARARVDALALMAESLATLVPDEGLLLADSFTASWRARLPHVRTRYGATAKDPEVNALEREHLITFAHLALICFQWRPEDEHLGMVEEILDFVRAEAAFFDERVLYELLASRDEESTYELRALNALVHDTLDIEDGTPALTDEQRGQVANRFAAEVLTRTAQSVYAGGGNASGKIDRALELVDRARELCPERAMIEFQAAQLLVLGRYFDEAQAAVARCQRFAKRDDHTLLSRLEEIQGILEQQRKDQQSGNQRNVTRWGAETGTAGFASLEREIDQHPSSLRAYEELIRSLAASGNFVSASEWCERAIARCLGRQAQLRARGLSLEISGLSELHSHDARSAQMFLAGTRGQALDAIDAALKSRPRTYALAYVRGQCLLAAERPEEARREFEWALQQCDRQLYRPVLRRLAADIDHAYVEHIREVITEATNDGRIPDALQAASSAMSRLTRPEQILVDLARIFLSAAVAHFGVDAQPLSPPRIDGVDAPWCARLVAMTRTGSDLERAGQIASLAGEVCEAARDQAEALIHRVETLARQARIVDALAMSKRAMERGDFEGALAALEPAGDGEPRVLRQQALILLRLDRFPDADQVASRLGSLASPLAQEFLAQYPAFRARRKIACVHRLLATGDTQASATLLDTIEPTDAAQILEVAYCRAFCLASEGYRHRREANRQLAITVFENALQILAPHLAGARDTGHTRLVALCERLEDDLDRLRGY